MPSNSIIVLLRSRSYVDQPIFAVNQSPDIYEVGQTTR